MGTGTVGLELPLATQADLSLALERAGAAYGAYELSARRTRAAWRVMKYGLPFIIAAILIGYALYFRQVQINDALGHRLTAMSANQGQLRDTQDQIVPALNRLTTQTAQPPIVNVEVAADGEAHPSVSGDVPSPQSSPEAVPTPTPPVIIVPPAVAPAVPALPANPIPTTAAEAPKVTPNGSPPINVPDTYIEVPTDTECLLDLICVKNILG